MKYRILTNDVGPHQYSAFLEISANNQDDADRKAIRATANLPADPRRLDKTLRVVALPEDQRHLHDGQTGKLSPKFAGTIIEIK